MILCDDHHAQVAFDDRNYCPACTLRDDLTDAMTEAQEEVKNLESKVEDLNDEITELQEQNRCR